MNLKLFIPLIAIIVLSLGAFSLVFAEDHDITPSVAQNIHGEIIDNDIVLTWNEPEFGTPITQYSVSGQEYGSDSTGTFPVGKTTDTYIEVNNLIHEQEYIFWITATNEVGKGDKSSGYSITIPTETEDESLEENPDCNERDNRNKDKCMMLENYVEDYRLDVLEDSNKELESRLAEYDTMMYEMEEEMEVMYDKMMGYEWADSYEMPTVATLFFTGDDTMERIVEIQLYQESKASFVDYDLQVKHKIRTLIGSPTDAPATYLEDLSRVPENFESEMYYVLNKVDGSTETVSYCVKKSNEELNTDNCFLDLTVKKGETIIIYHSVNYTGDYLEYPDRARFLFGLTSYKIP